MLYQVRTKPSTGTVRTMCLKYGNLKSSEKREVGLCKTWEAYIFNGFMSEIRPRCVEVRDCEIHEARQLTDCRRSTALSPNKITLPC